MELGISVHHALNTIMYLRKLITLFLLTSSVPLMAQTNWKAIEVSLYKQVEERKISSGEWYSKLKSEAGYLDDLKLWVKSEEAITDKKEPEKLSLRFPERFQTTTENGNKFAIIYLKNNTVDSVEIARIDATIDNVREYFFIDNKWVAFRTNGKSTCGNSYFNNKLAPKHQLSLELENGSLIEGKNKIKYKVQIKLGNQFVESNVINVYLHDNQLKRIKETLNGSKP